jgi:hypothetical protein
MKINASFRISPDALRLMKAVAEAKGISQTAVVEIALRDLAKREKIRIEKNDQANLSGEGNK